MPEAKTTRTRMGLVEYCMGIQARNKRLLPDQPDCSTALGFLEQAIKLGAGGIQCSLKAADLDTLDVFRKRLDAAGLFFEASISLPKDRSDAERFENDIKRAKQAGASFARTAVATRKEDRSRKASRRAARSPGSSTSIRSSCGSRRRPTSPFPWKRSPSCSSQAWGGSFRNRPRSLLAVSTRGSR